MDDFLSQASRNQVEVQKYQRKAHACDDRDAPNDALRPWRRPQMRGHDAGTQPRREAANMIDWTRPPQALDIARGEEILITRDVTTSDRNDVAKYLPS